LRFYISLIAEHPFFIGLEKRYLELVTGCAFNVRFDTGQFIYRAGEEANQFFIIRQGKVAMEIYPPENQANTIQTISEDEVLGWSWLVPPYHYQFDAQVEFYRWWNEAHFQ
jgi:hypothetical protein